MICTFSPTWESSNIWRVSRCKSYLTSGKNLLETIFHFCRTVYFSEFRRYSSKLLVFLRFGFATFACIKLKIWTIFFETVNIFKIFMGMILLYTKFCWNSSKNVLFLHSWNNKKLSENHRNYIWPAQNYVRFQPGLQTLQSNSISRY